MEIKSINNLKDNLEKLIDKHRLNMKLRKKITNEFLSKGLNIEVVQMLFEDDIQINQLNKYGTLAAPFLDNIINNSSKSNNNATAGVEINETEIKELSEYRESLKINKNEVELLSDFLKLDWLGGLYEK